MRLLERAKTDITMVPGFYTLTNSASVWERIMF